MLLQWLQATSRVDEFIDLCTHDGIASDMHRIASHHHRITSQRIASHHISPSSHRITSRITSHHIDIMQHVERTHHDMYVPLSMRLAPQEYQPTDDLCKQSHSIEHRGQSTCLHVLDMHPCARSYVVVYSHSGLLRYDTTANRASFVMCMLLR